MADFSIGEAVSFGFRLARERPAAIAVWAVLQLVFTFSTTAVLISMAGPALTELQTASAANGEPQDPAAAMALLGRVAPAYGVAFALWLVNMALMLGAATRAVLWPDDDRLGYVRLGGDEVRMVVVLLIIGAILFGAYVAGAMVLGLVGGMFAATAGPAGFGLSLLVLVPLLLAALLWLWARFSLAPAASLAKGGIDVFGSWALTRGRSGKVFLAMMTANLLYLLVALLGFAIFAGIASAVGGSPEILSTVLQADMSSLSAYLSPLMIVYLAVMAVFAALGTAIALCPPAVIYLALAGEEPHAVF